MNSVLSKTITLNKLQQQWEFCSNTRFFLPAPLLYQLEKTLKESLGKTEVDNEPFLLQHIFDTFGVQETLWALQTIDGVDEKKLQLYSKDVAERALNVVSRMFPNNTYPQQSLDALKDFVLDKINTQELNEIFLLGKKAWKKAISEGGYHKLDRKSYDILVLREEYCAFVSWKSAFLTLSNAKYYSIFCLNASMQSKFSSLIIPLKKPEMEEQKKLFLKHFN